MIKIGATTVLLQDPSGQLDQHIERHHSLDLMRAFGAASAVQIPRGSNLLFPNYPSLPAPRLNQIVIPTGATRWSHGLFLATTSQKDAILTEAALPANGGKLKVSFGSSDAWRGTGTQANPVRPDLTLTMSPLPPRPLTATNLPTAASGVQDLWLIPMVDQRYWWQRLNVGLIEQESISTITELIDYLNSRLNGTASLLLSCANPKYNKLPDVITGNNYENVATVIETVAWHIGCQVVPEINSYSSRNTAVNTGFSLISVDDSPIVHANNLLGQVGFSFCNRAANGTVTSLGSGWEAVGIPAIEMGGPLPAVSGSAFLPAKILVLVGEGTTAVMESRSSVDVGLLDAKVVSGTEAVLRTRYADGNVIDGNLRDQIVKDFYNRFSRSHDYTFAGVQKWQPTAFDDCVTVFQTRFADGFRCQTRVRSWGQNLLPETLVTAAAKSSGGSNGCSCDCIDEGDIFVDGFETSSRWAPSTPIPQIAIEQTNGWIDYAGGVPTLRWSAANGYWVVDISSSLSARYITGAPVPVGSVSLSGDLRMYRSSGGKSIVKLTVSGDIPAPP